MATTPSSTPGPERTQDRPRGELRVMLGAPSPGDRSPQAWRAPRPGHCPLLTQATSTFHCCAA